ncbi:uncharacterized protein A1O9_04489 [Exophiala aquamarina CBS 119918]|uniref:Transcription factor domain-containing protein n=1 Tax=Exophiala aquamarina CBS 119918 TaxID=1182545 RepID=A0A072PJZ1_9EURO|nr:uncharacterized protein A1O9_04489 [Exophiala aquamarina CBS 119918]KEF59643.1 hypothetical protein A1O9_04489 [Exophiala aquamarina CBS 119918]
MGNVDHIQHAKPTTKDPDIGSPGQNETSGSEAEQVLSLNQECDDVSPPTLQTPTSQNCPRLKAPATPGYTSPVICQILGQSLDTLLSNTQLQMDFFTQTICKSLTAFDSKHNAFKRVAVSRTKESLLFFSLTRYITAAFLNSSALDSTSALVVQTAQTEILYRLHSEVAQLALQTRANIEDVLMVIIMFGLTTNWDGSNSPSILHYNAAVRLYLHTYGNSTPHSPQNDHQELFLPSLVYWWMGLAFVTDTSKECLLDPPPLETSIRNGTETVNFAKRIPHPLAGVSPEVQKLLGRVGSLTYGQRLSCREKSFTSMIVLYKEYNSLQRAQNLEEEALSLKLPKADEFIDSDDMMTPIQDLINTAEVYRFAALILLYQAFPDLLSRRLRLDEDDLDGDQSSKERRLLWVTALAIQALKVLCQNTPGSGTRSIEQILLVIIGGALLNRTCSQTSYMREESDRSTLERSIAGLGPPSLPIRSAFNQHENLYDFSGHETLRNVIDSSFGESSVSDCIAEARRTVCKRLQSIREILPYRSLEIVQELVFKTWDISDNDTPEVFWIDIMIENGWSFLLV